MKSADRFTLGPIDLSIPAGFVTAIVGPNGSGKSTLFRLLVNLTRPDRGRIEVLNRTYPEDDLELREKIGFMPDSYDLIDESMTARQMADFTAPFYRRWDAGRYRRLLERFRIDEHKRFRKMSRGMIQKFSFAMTLAQSPELLLLDEPSAGLDPLAWQDMLDEIHRYMEHEGHTVVIATHHIEEVRRLADYVVFMYEGNLLGMYEKDSLFEEWREVWINGEITDLSEIDGLCYIDVRQPHRLITHQYTKLSEELQRRGVRIYQTQPVALDEIMRYMIHMHA